VSPVKYELGFYISEDIFIVTAMKPSNLTYYYLLIQLVISILHLMKTVTSQEKPLKINEIPHNFTKYTKHTNLSPLVNSASYSGLH
jgi:hypothetical protein